MSEVTFATPTNASTNATAGKDYLIYLNTGATEANPTWTLLGGQRSGDLSRQADEIGTPATRLAAAGKQLSLACVPGPLTSKAFTWLVMQVQNSLKRHFWPAKECILNLNTLIKAILQVGAL